MANIDMLNQARWFRSNSIAPGIDASKIDFENGIIHDVVMIEEGEAKGHDIHIDSDFITKLAAYDKATFGDRGVKARLGHPGASDNTMGKQLGFMRNVRTRRQNGKMQAIANLHLLSSADASPTAPNMREWVLQMAQEAPDFLMNSIVFKGSGFYQKKANGHRKTVDRDSEIDASLGPVFIDFDPENGASHHYTDMVEQGAATNNLFSTTANPHFFVSRLHEWLDFNPDILDFVKTNPKKVQAFLNRLGIDREQNKPNTMSTFSLKAWLLGESDAAPNADELETLKTELSEAQRAASEMRENTRTELSNLKSELEKAQGQITDLTAQNTTLTEKVTALQADIDAKAAKIAELEKAPAAEHTAGDGAGGDGKPKARAYHNTPMNQKVEAIRKRFQKDEQD